MQKNLFNLFQRAYDQVVHDVAIQSLPVRFAIDRAGLVGQMDPLMLVVLIQLIYQRYQTLL